MKKMAYGGNSKLTVDNTNGGSHVYVKLCPPVPGRCNGLRHLFLPQGGSFTMGSIASGDYEIRYQDISSGYMAKSELIQLRQVEDAEGIRYSVVKLTLYRVSGGNTSFTPLSKDDF